MKLRRLMGSLKPKTAPYCIAIEAPSEIFGVGLSALGHKRTCAVQKVMSALPLKADMCGALANVR